MRVVRELNVVYLDDTDIIDEHDEIWNEFAAAIGDVFHEYGYKIDSITDALRAVRRG